MLNQQQAPSSPDLIKILIRWKWLPILGSLIGATVGSLYFGQLAPKYKAIAQVQVVSPAREIPINNMDRGSEHSRGDEVVVVQSSVVLNQAVELGRLTQHRKLVGKSAEEIVRMIRMPKVLEVKLGSNDLNSDILKIGVTTDDAELSGEIAKAIVAGYEEHVTSKFRTYSKEALTALTKFSDTYDKRRNDARKELENVKKNPNLIWLEGDRPHDPVADKIIKYNEKILEIDTQVTNIEAVLQQVEIGRNANRPTQELLQMVNLSTRDSGYRPQEDSDSTMQRNVIQQMMSQIEVFEQDRVVPQRSEVALLNAQSLGDSHPTVVAAQQKLAKLEDQLQQRKTKLRELEEIYGANKADSPTIDGRLAIACGALKETLQKSAFERNEYRQKIDALKEQMQVNQATISSFAINLADFKAVSEVASQISENLRKLSMGTEYGQKTVTRLEVPEFGTFSGPYLLQYFGVGGLLGFLAFCGLAYLLELADRSYRNPDEIAMDLGMPIVGHLPLATISRADRIDEKVDSSIITLHKNRSPMSEAFRGVRTALFFGCQQNNIKVIQVTSPIPGDGKSTVAANIAVSMAQAGRRVCLVDCDFRRPRVAKMFGLREDIGLVQVLGGKTSLEDAIQQTSIENFSSVTCGRRPGNPAELLSSELFGELVSQLRAKFDFVVIDTPPMLAVSDPAIVANHVDGVVLTIRLRRNLKPIASRAAQMLHAINANMIGVVVNGIGVGGNGYGYGGYRYDNYSGARSTGYGRTGYGGYGYGATYQYGGYYGGNNVGRDYYKEQAPKVGNQSTVSNNS
jgi:capsular exopolysaccharide synthesis family protein